MICSKCGNDVKKGSRFCKNCGIKVESRCSKCGKEVKEDSQFCKNCGNPIVSKSKEETPVNDKFTPNTETFRKKSESLSSNIKNHPIIFCIIILICGYIFFSLFSNERSGNDKPKSSVQTVVSDSPPPPIQTVAPTPPSPYPNVSSALAVLFEGEGLMESGKYSPDQQEELFNRNYKNKIYLVSGEISSVGKTSFTESKYITIKVNNGHYFDVYPSFDFDLLDYSKGAHVSFIGEWTFLGSGIMFHHKIENAERAD